MQICLFLFLGETVFSWKFSAIRENNVVLSDTSQFMTSVNHYDHDNGACAELGSSSHPAAAAIMTKPTDCNLSTSPLPLPSPSARVALRTCPLRSTPSAANILATMRATVVLPVPGLPENTMCSVPCPMEGSPAARRSCARTTHQHPLSGKWEGGSGGDMGRGFRV